MARPKRPIEYFTATDGRRLVAVTLASHRGEAVLQADDFAGLLAQGISANWMLNSNGCGNAYVRSNMPDGGCVRIARLVIGAGANQHVHFLDRNPRNLRPENLSVSERRHCTLKCPLHRTRRKCA